MKTEYHRYHQSQEPQGSGVSISSPGEDCRPAQPGGCPPLLYLYSNISTEPLPEEEKTQAIIGLASLLSPYSKKVAHTLYVNVERLIAEAPSLGHIGFGTLTFEENITDNAEASRRFNSLNTHFLNADSRFGIKIIIKEPQVKRGKKNGDSGAWHFHLLVILSEDIRTGFDFEGIEKQDYRSASPYLRQLWKDLREACEKYGFGRSELLPVKSNAEAMGRYLGKYISKGIGQRSEEQKNVRLVNYSKGWTRNSPKFAWNTKNSAEWRKKLSLFARIHGCQEFYQLSDKLGPNWAYRYLDDIINVYEAANEHFEQYRYTEEGSKIDRQTGEAMTPEQLEYTDRIFKRITDNDRKKTQLLHAEVLDLVPPKSTYKHWQKTQRKKEEGRITIERAKSEWIPKERPPEPEIPF